MDLAGSIFVAIAGQSALPGLGASDVDDNAEFRATEGGLAAALVKAFGIDPRDRVAVIAPARDALRLSLSRRTGLVRGRFTPAAGERPLGFSGAVLQSQAHIGGFFLGRKESGTITIAPDDTPGAP